MALQLYVQYPNPDANTLGSNPWIILETSDEEPIKLTFSVGDISDPLKVASTYSKSFRIPHTIPNGEWFHSVFNVNGTYFDPSKLSSSYITDNGEILVTGNLRLTSIFRDDVSGGIWYEVLFMGETSDFSSNISGFYLSDIDLTKYNHAVTYTNITNSWSGGLFNGDIRYPLVEWGYEYLNNSSGGFDPVQNTLSNGASKSFTTSAHPLALSQMKPAIRVKALWDSIIAPAFDAVGWSTTTTATLSVVPTPSPGTLPTSIAFVVDTNLNYRTGSAQKVIIQYNETIWMRAVVLAYDRTTGIMSVQVTSSSGSGTYSNWAVNLITNLSLSGYSYTENSFMNSTLFNNLYLLLDSEARATSAGDQSFSAITDYQSNSAVYTKYEQGTLTALDVNKIIYDKGNNYDITSGQGTIYRTPTGGVYSFTIAVDAFVEGGGCISGNSRARFRILLYGGSTLYWTGPIAEMDNTNPSSVYVTTSAGVTIPGGVDLKIYIQVLPSINNIFCGRYIAPNSISWKSTLTPTFINLNAVLSNQIKVLDFIRGIIDKFKLVFIPSKVKPKEFEIIPWIDWVRSGRVQDWTDKVDYNVEYKVSPLFIGQPRNTIYKDTDDTDYLNYNYQQANQKTYGQLNLNSNNLLLNGDITRTTIFAPTPLGPLGIGADPSPDNVAQRFLIPHLSKATIAGTGDGTNTKIEPILPKLRLVFWNGLQPVPTYLDGLTVVPLLWYIQKETGPVVAQDSIPLVSNFYNWPVDQNTLDMRWDWAPQLYNTALQTISNPEAVTNLNMYIQYWKGWYDSVNDPYSRINDMTIIIDYNDIKDLQFNDYVWIKDSYYFVDKITDYVVGRQTKCKVSLYKVGTTLGITLPNGITRLIERRLCYNTVSKCNAVCCTGSLLASSPYFFISLTGITAYQSRIYADPFGNITVPAGYYAYGTIVYTVGSGGMIIAVSTETGCSCGAGGAATQTVNFSPASNETVNFAMSNVLCPIPIDPPITFDVYGQQSDTIFADNVRFFLDSDFTIPVPDGAYYPVSEGGDLGWSVEGSNVRQITSKNMCNCPVVNYPITLGYGIDVCTSCCFDNGSNLYWSDSVTIVLGTNLYIDEDGSTPVDAGFYSNGTDTFEADGSGLITSITSCSSCSCVDTADIYLEWTTDIPGTGTLILEQSFDRVNWFYVGQIDITPADPIGIPVIMLFPVTLGAWTKASSVWDGTSGAEVFEYLIDGRSVQTVKVPLPFDTSVTIESQDQVSSGPYREYRVTIIS